MDRVKCIGRWGLLLWKRLYKKASFVALLLLIPVLVFGYGRVSQEDSGLITVALASEAAPVEPLTQAIWQELMESNVVRYIVCDTPEQARSLVAKDRADVAWIFMEDLEGKIYTFAADRTRKNAFVTIVEPKDRVLLKLAREILSGVMFSHCSEAVYLQYIRKNVPELSDVTDEQLLSYYHNVELEEGLFVFSDIQGNVTPQQEQEHYLLTPVRGMLAVVMVLAGLATAMYYSHDLRQGTFAWVPQRWLWAVELGCQMITAVNIGAAALLSLGLTGQLNGMIAELAAALLYSLCVSGFAMVLRRIAGGIRGTAMVTPLLVVAMLAICPIFINIKQLRLLQMAFPPTYYVNALVDGSFFGPMALYAAGLLLLCLLIDRCAAMKALR
jgi:hypothetical protein